MRKELRILPVALFFAAAANAAGLMIGTVTVPCPGTGNVATSLTNGGTPVITNAVFVCPPYLNLGPTVTAVDVLINNFYTLGLAGTNIVDFTYALSYSSASGSPGINPFGMTQLTDQLVGDVNPISDTWVNTGGSCTNPAGLETNDCTSLVYLPMGDTYGSITITGSSGWGGGGLQMNGTVEIDDGSTPILEEFTYVVPEPATWLLAGGGLAGLALARRRKLRT